MVQCYLAILFIILISGCGATTTSSGLGSASDSAIQPKNVQSSDTPPEPTQISSTANEPATVDAPSSDSEGVQSQEVESKENALVADDSASAATADVTANSKSASLETESRKAVSKQPESEGERQTVANPQNPLEAAPLSEAEVTAASTVPKRSPKTLPQAIPDIQIDETVCGAGGQEAYFETRRQEIYICRNETAALTYIATPKKQGNSVFLPATAIPDGDKTAYMAQDGMGVVVVGPFGYRREENGKAIAKERVIRNR